MYTIKLPANMEIPKKYKSIIDTYCDVGKLFKKGKYKFVLIYEDGNFLKKLINPRFKEVSEIEFREGFYLDGFILDQDGKAEFYIKL